MARRILHLFYPKIDKLLMMLDMGYNGITLTPILYHHFQRFEMFFDTLNALRNEFVVDSFYPQELSGILPVTLQFESTGIYDITEPNQTLLGLHEIFARILHYSGAADYIDNIDEMDSCLM